MTILDLSECVNPTDVSFQWIVDHLEGKSQRWDLLRKTKKLSKITYEQITGGFCSFVMKVDLQFFMERHPFTCFLKVPTTNKMAEIKLEEEFLNGMERVLIFGHNREIDFYELLAVDSPVMEFPRLFGSERSHKGSHGRALIEDISTRGTMADVQKGLSIAQSVAVVRSLARLHAYSRYSDKSPKILAAFEETELAELNGEQHHLPERLSRLDEYFEKNREPLLRLLDAGRFAPADPHKKFGIKPVIAHGDLWGNNIFFTRKPDGTASDKILTFIDFQFAHTGTGMADLARFIAVSTSAGVQRLFTDRFLKVYYETMANELAMHNHSIGYDFETMREMYKYEYPNEGIFALLMLCGMAEKATDPSVRQKLADRTVAVFDRCREQFVERPTVTIDFTP